VAVKRWLNAVEARRRGRHVRFRQPMRCRRCLRLTQAPARSWSARI